MCQKINKLLCISLFFTVVHAKPKWIYPSKSLCSQYKGFYDSSEGICEANLNNGIKICEAMGARLPILKEYKDIAQACGAIIVDKKDISCDDKSK